MNKTIDDYFYDWFHEPFRFGYGTGEEFILNALKNLANSVQWNKSGDNYTYDYEKLYPILSETVTWLLINALAKNGDIEYGTSPRFGWFYGKSKRLIDYIKKHSVDEMYNIVASKSSDETWDSCFDDYCSCRGTQVHHRCKYNPFWNDKPKEKHE